MVFEKCEFCGVKFDRMKTVKYKHKSYCSFLCKENAIDAESHVNGLYLPGTSDDNPSRDLFDWAYANSRTY
jgi:hypothetical protein